MYEFYKFYINKFLLLLLLLSNITLLYAQDDDPYADCPYGSQPELTLITEANAIVCTLPGEIHFQLKGYDNEYNRKAHYYISFGDGSDKSVISYQSSAVGDEILYKDFPYSVDYTNEQLADIEGLITHKYTTSYCELGTQGSWVINILVIGCDPQFTQMTFTTLKLQKAGTVGFNNFNICDYKVEFTNFSGGFVNSMCKEVELYKWEFGDGEELSQLDKKDTYKPAKTIEHEYKCAGVYDVTLYGYSSVQTSGGKLVGSSCGSDNITKEILVLPKPKLKKKSNINICTGEKVEEVKLQDLDVCTYDWYDKASKQCKPTDVCGILGEKVAYAFNYKVTGDYVGLDLGEYNVQEEDAKIPSFKAINNSDVAKKVKICITPYNEIGCPGEEMCYEILVHPSAKISNLKDVSFCDNTTAKINPFQSSISGVTYEWSVKSGDWSAIGLPSESGSGHMPTFTAKNSTSSPITVTIEVVANSSLCKGSVGEFKITVYPLPKYDIASQSPTTCNGTDGWIEFKNLGLNVTKYLVKYKKDGTDVEKTINVQGSSVKVTGLSKGSYTEIKIAAFGSECFVGTTDITLVDPPIPNVPVISSNSPVCIGDNLVLNVDNADADINSWKWTGPECSGGVVPSTLKNPTPKPMQYCMAGEYTLQVERNKCYAESKILVTYREDPEVTLSQLSSVCVGTSFKIDDEVAYNWKRIPLADQKIKWEIINNLGTVVTTQNDIQYPSFTINQAGDYTVRVSLEGFGCNGTKLVAEQPIKVKQVNYTLDVKADKNQICANEKVEFTNNTSKNDEIKYNWTVSPTTGVVFSDGTTKTSDAPKILFQEPGKYTVEVVADNECTKRTQTFNINVRKNPTVVLNKLPDLCSGKTFNEVNDYVTYTWNNVEGETPVWSATPADGVVFSDPNSNYPTITYTKAGNYTIKVEMPDISCGIKSYAESTVKVYDGSFTVDITQDKTVICEGEEVGFDNKTFSTDPIKYQWSVSPTDGAVIPNATDASPKIRFNNYGDFVISVLIDGICQDETKTFNVRVNKDPEVTFGTLGFTCTNKTFTLTSDLVSYVWNSVKDTEKKVTWSILDATGAEAAATAYTIDNVNALYPVLTFNTSGTYTLKVEVDGLGCSGTKTKAEAALTVYDNTFVLDLTQDKDVICEGEKVSFTNNTISSDPLDYTWSVSSMDGVTISDVKSTAPEITFTKYGDYVVTVVMDGKCSDQTKTFNVRVNKDPEVTFSPLGFTCTNKTFTLTSDLVSYVWNSVKDTEKKVTWSILDATGAEAAATAYTIDNVNALYPVLTFNTSGTYTLKVEVDGLGCSGTKTKAEAALTVYDNTFVLDLTQDKDVICEGEKVSFTNNTISSDPLDYTWSVSSMDGVTISDVKSTAPEITFTKYGDYVVTVVMDGKCSDQTATYNVRVKKDPEVKFGTLETICNNNKFTFDNTKVVYTWYNMLETEKEIEWTVTPNTGVTEEDTDKEYPSYTFTETGDYTITIKVKAMGCSQAYIEESVKVTVISDNLDLQVSAAPLEGCVPLDIAITNTTSDTDEIEYKWTVNQSDDDWDFKQGSESAKSPIFTLNKENSYKISLEAKNKCNTKTLDFNIEAYDEVHFKLAAIPIVCGEYIFDAKSEEQGLTVTGKTENIKSIKWVVYKSTDYTNINYQEAPTESYEFTSGDADDLYPVIKIKEWGKYKIELQTQTICNDETISTTVDIEKPIEITLTQPDPLCANIADEYGQNPYTLVADPIDGTWSWGMDIATEKEEYLDPTNKFFYPNTPGTYKLKYSVQRQACYAEKSMDVVVKDYPTMDIGADIYVCEKDQTPVLLEGTPNDGVWTGNEVSKNGSEYYFNPPLTVGDYDITYTITDAFGCKNRDYKQAHIQPLPNPNFEPKAHCLPDPVTFLPVVDVTTHQFKLDYGDGTNGTDLTHLYGEIGNYDVKLIVTAPNGCVDSLTQVLLVEKYPDQKLIVSEHEGCSPFTPEIKIEYDYSDPNVEFLWDFGPFGKQTTEQPTPVEFTTVERDTTYQFSITVKNHCGEYTVTDTVRVLALPVAKMIPSIGHGCSPLNVDFKNISLGSIRGMNYTWDFGDGSPLEYDFRVSHQFTTDHKNDSTYKVMLVAENQCGTDTTYQDIYIIPPVVYPQIVNPTPKVCVGDEVCILNETMEILPHSEIITYKWDFGNGKISDDPKDACTVYDEPSTYMITLNITTSCGSSETDVTYVEVQKQPNFKISAPDYVCHLDTVKPEISMLSRIREVTWDFGDGNQEKIIDPKHSYSQPGEYIITATATEDNFASCQASKSIPILVRELPNPEIEPLKADSCSPFVYAPKIAGEISYAIDYENNGIKEANESHTYINKGLEPIIYNTTIYLEDEYGCKSQKYGLVNVYPEPVAGISIAEVVNERPEVVTFASTSFGADVCRWTLPFAGKLESCQEIKEYFNENKTETIYLEVANMYGCVDNDSIDYTPVFKGLYFPNTFSPNGVLEEVRTFNGVGLGLASYQLEIFDLYGNLIFKTTSLDANGSPNEGWDGRDRLGNLMPQDVYSWKVEAVYIDGSHYPYGNDIVNEEGKEVNDVTVQRGSVLLLHR